MDSNSKVARRYIHFSARVLEEAVLKIHELKQLDETNILLRRADCPMCGRKNSPAAQDASTVVSILDKETAIKTEQERRGMKILDGLRGLGGLFLPYGGSEQNSLTINPLRFLVSSTIASKSDLLITMKSQVFKGFTKSQNPTSF